MNEKATSPEAELASGGHQNASQLSAAARPPAHSPKACRALTNPERWWVGALSLLLGFVLLWALALPWHAANWFTVLCVLTGTGHIVTALTCLTHRFGPRPPLVAWRVTSLFAATLLAWVTWIVVRSGTYLSALYGGLGEGLTAAMVAIWGLAVLVTLPLLAWGLARTRGCFPRLSIRHGLFGVAVWLVGVGFALSATSHVKLAAATPPSVQEWTALVNEEVAPVVSQLRPARNVTLHGRDKRARLDPRVNVTCPRLADGATRPTAVVHYTPLEGGRSRSSCVTQPTLQRLARSVSDLLQKRAARSPVALDLITHVRNLDTGPSWLTALRVRPGLDGVCLGDNCLAPWQLLAQSAFITHAPLEFLADLKFGVSLAKLRPQLQSDNTKLESAPLLAIATHNIAIATDGTATPLRRLRPEHAVVSRATVMKAEALFEDHILQSQLDNGQFRYTLDPFTGKKETRNFNLPRQAGTLLAICELGRDTEVVRDAIHKGLSLLLKHARKRDGEWVLALQRNARVVRLGDAALPLIAFLSCRSRVGADFDSAVSGLSRFVLRMQNPDGSFASNYDWRKRKKLDGPEALYAPGQALMALVLLDRLLFEPSDQAFTADVPLRDEQLRRAVQTGMDHVAHQHWDVPVYSFFFIEENWNCLAARAALARQRNDAYERFCLDYMTFKSRLMLDDESRVDPQYIGGFGFGNVIPPHNTGAAGVGEALAAVIAIKAARQEELVDQHNLMRELIGFLLRQQWTSQNCFACVPEAIGAVSEHTHSPITRIDFAQHAWAAIGHGQRALEL